MGAASMHFVSELTLNPFTVTKAAMTMLHITTKELMKRKHTCQLVHMYWRKLNLYFLLFRDNVDQLRRTMWIGI
jgi:hypothetical protein